MSFEAPENVFTQRSTLSSLLPYLDWLSDRSRLRHGGIFQRDVDVTVSVGNYYQILSWIRSRDLDAAVVSPFMAYVLERRGDALPLVEFREFAATGAGHRPLIGVNVRGGAGRAEEFDAYLEALLEEARCTAGGLASAGCPDLPGRRRRTRVHAVSHLSSSGFIAPILYVERWLEDRARRSSGEADRFWRLFFNELEFTLHHGVCPDSEAPPADSGEATSIYFSYSGRNQQARDRDEGSCGVKWREYEISQSEGALIPLDVLVIRPEIARDIFRGDGSFDAARSAHLVPELDAQATIFSRPHGYRSVQPFSASVHQLFRSRIDDVFSRNAPNRILRQLNQRWFEEGRYDFSLTETIDLLRLDQRNSKKRDLSLVLPGGGVKSVYQAEILDRLYTERAGGEAFLVNAGRVEDAEAIEQLVVDNVVGTSGGAMVGLFTALGIPETGTLAEIATKAARTPVFPLVNILRWLSVLLLICLLVIFCNLARLPRLWRLRHRLLKRGRQPWLRGRLPTRPPPPWFLSVLLWLLVPLTPFLVSFATGETGFLTWLEIVLYGLTIVLIHFALTCLEWSPSSSARSPGWRAGFGPQAVVLMALGLSLAGFGMLNSLETVWPVAAGGLSPELLWALSMSSIGGVALFVLGILYTAYSERFGLRLRRVGEYFRSAAAVALYVTAAHLILLIYHGARDSTLTRLLEASPSFWRELLYAGSATAVTTGLILAWRSARRPLLFLRRGLTFFVSRERFLGIRISPGTRLIWLLGLGLVGWVALAAPGVYDGDDAFHAFAASVEKALTPEDLEVKLTVTGVLLDDVGCRGSTRRLREGELYFCFSGGNEHSQCPAGNDPRWLAMSSWERSVILDAVFASGSPFPVLPPHPLTLADGCEIPLVDGGYVHNIPIEASVIGGARQVLIVHSSPLTAPEREDGHSPFSLLVRYGARVFPFLLERAQEVDRNVSRNLFVASLAPYAVDREFPLLTEFTDATIGRLRSWAEEDIAVNRRIGSIDSWGLPEIHRDPGRSGAGGAAGGGEIGFSAEVEAELARLLSEPGEGKTAVFDFDNTCIKNDIGEAVFLQLILSLGYRGDREEFWKLFPDASAAAALRGYWNANKASGRTLSLASLATWDQAARDYVVLFWSQYEVLEERDVEAAYGWVVRLLAGLSKQEVKALARMTWERELERSTAPLYLQSRNYGRVKLNGGIRAFSQMRELIRRLHGRGWEVWVISASNHYSVREVAVELGVDPQKVLGIELVEGPDGELTSELVSPITYRQGKAAAMARFDLHPSLVAGDSLTDLEMLHESTDVALVIDRGTIPADRLRSGWLVQAASELSYPDRSSAAMRFDVKE